MVKLKGHIDLFSGIGGFSKGLHEAGVVPDWIGFSDIDEHANKLFKRRFKDAEELGSITNVSYESLGGRELDLLTAGFPCQAFSVAGKRRGFEDTRGTLFFDVARILKEYIDNGKPIKHFLLENVKGLLMHEGGSTFATIYGVLTDLGYSVETQLVNTKWWLPQNRERIYFFGEYTAGKRGREVFPIRPSDGNDAQQGIQEGGLDIADWRSDEGIRVRKNGVSPTLTTSVVPFLLPKVKPAALRTWPRESGMTDEEKQERGKRLEIRDDGVANTITQHVMDSMIVHYDTSKVRRLHPIECERLQGFPDNWTDGQSDTQRYKQCGNAVSVCVTKNIFKKIFKREIRDGKKKND